MWKKETRETLNAAARPLNLVSSFSLFIGETMNNRKRNGINRPLFGFYGKYKVGIDYI